MTPRQIHALRKRQITQWQREEVLFGNIPAAIANWSFSPPKKPQTAEMYMMHPFKPEPLTGPDAGDAVLAQMRALSGAFVEVIQ